MNSYETFYALSLMEKKAWRIKKGEDALRNQGRTIQAGK